MSNILVCVTGLTPQIVTESLYCLSVQQKIEINEIYILTTVRGKRVIEGIDKAVQTPNTNLKDELKQLCIDYNLEPPVFKVGNKHIITAKEESVELADIRSDKDNILFPNRVSEFIKNKTSNSENILYCSISGGRKTMSVHLANALSMFGRENDKLLHVLTAEEHEFKGFYPKTLKEDKALVISDIPFIRLRSVISPSLSSAEFSSKSYTEFVKFTQKELSIISDESKLLLNTITREISFKSQKIKMEPLQFAIYFKFIEHATESEESLSIETITSPEFGREIRIFLDEYIPSYHLNESMHDPWWKKGFDAESFRSKRSKINSKLKKIFADDNYYDTYMIKSNKVYANSTYSVSAKTNKVSIIYKE